MRFSLRIAPVLIFVATLMLSVKLGDIWTAVSEQRDAIDFQPASAETAPEAPVKEEEKAEATPPAVQSLKPVDAKDGEVSGVGDVSKMSYSEIQLLQELAVRRKSLEGRERKLDQRAVLLKAAEQRLVERQGELKKIRFEIKNLLNIKEKEEAERLKRLVAIYSNMKPKDAAKIFNELDMSVLIDVMQSMKERKIASIVAAMDADRARKLTKQLAERQDVPKIPK
ncbi:MAG: hypothetical protein GKS00_10700 [Alphaproteobacteria bacterium]|nr:hypothetical protein [Alphaproteobacteria bacterium]